MAEQELHKKYEKDSVMHTEEVGLKRLDFGLFQLQKVAVIMGHLWNTKDPRLQKRLLHLLHMRGQSLKSIWLLILEFYAKNEDFHDLIKIKMERVPLQQLVQSLRN